MQSALLCVYVAVLLGYGRSDIAPSGTCAGSSDVCRSVPKSLQTSGSVLLQLDNRISSGFAEYGQRMERAGPVEPSRWLSKRSIQGPFEVLWAATSIPIVDDQLAWVAWKMAISVLAILLGFFCRLSSKTRRASVYVMYFGAQSFMTIYMKVLLSEVQPSNDSSVHGIPAPALILGVQQITGFVLICAWAGISHWTPWPFRPTPVRTRRSQLLLIATALAFTCNITLNNLSLSLLTLSVNLVIRSCSPLSVVILECLAGWRLCVTQVDAMLLLLGSVCTAVVVAAKSEASESGGHAALGVCICLLSLLSASLELVVVRDMGEERLNPMDLLFYMPIPVAMLLVGPIFFVPHVVPWPGYSALTDWQIFTICIKSNPTSAVLIVLSGVFSVAYNGMLYSIVQAISPAHASYASNFNKVAVICLSMAFGFEHLPSHPWSFAFIGAAVGNIGAFTAISARAASSKAAASSIEDTHCQAFTLDNRHASHILRSAFIQAHSAKPTSSGLGLSSAPGSGACSRSPSKAHLFDIYDERVDIGIQTDDGPSKSLDSGAIDPVSQPVKSGKTI